MKLSGRPILLNNQRWPTIRFEYSLQSWRQFLNASFFQKRGFRKQMEIINIGTYPPPYGGVSIHLIRLKHFLDRKRVSHQSLDISNNETSEKRAAGIKTCEFNKKVQLRLFLQEKAILHFHFFYTDFIMKYFLFSLRHIVILSFHNERFLEELKSRGKIKYYIYLILLNRIQVIIVDSTKCNKLACKVIRNKSKVHIIPEFIPPQEIPSLSQRAILDCRKSHKYLISSNAFKISFYNNEDLYGIDLLVEAVNTLCNTNGIDIAVAFLLPSIGNEDYFAKIKRKIQEYNIATRFLFITEPVEEASSLWKISDIVIRATNTDGNSLSILEALNVGAPVIASDCVERPEGTTVFKTRDLQDLTSKILLVINNLDYYKAKARASKPESNAMKMVSLYNSLRGRNKE